MSYQEKQSKLQATISDLEVLSQKCARDIRENIEINADYYLNEYNNLLTKAKQEQPDKVNDIQHLNKSGSGLQTKRYNELQMLYKIDAATDKLLGRLKPIGKESRIETLPVLERIFNRFHQVARQLRSRHNSRTTIDVSDEYDVQDLMHALLKIYFDDIRPEEWTPSYAGSSSRMDFLLKEEQVVVEVKKTRDNLRDKQIGEHLIVDIAKYGEHPNCKTLVCFVYDPEGFISNPAALENDLQKKSTPQLGVRVCINPK